MGKEGEQILKPFIDIVLSSNSFDMVFNIFRNTKSINNKVISYFIEKYDPKNKLSFYDTFKLFYDDVKSSNKKLITILGLYLYGNDIELLEMWGIIKNNEGLGLENWVEGDNNTMLLDYVAGISILDGFYNVFGITQFIEMVNTLNNL